MKMLLALLFALLSTLYMANSDAGLSPMETAIAAHVSLSTETGKIFCGGFAVDVHTVATAKHCVDAAVQYGKVVSYNGLSCPAAKVVETDSRDHVLVTTCNTFTHFAKLAPPPQVGEHIFVFGHPTGLPLMYREGTLAGFFPQPEQWLDVPIGSMAYLFDFNGWHGDSGSAIYNRKGVVVGMVSRGWCEIDERWCLGGGYGFNFKPATMTKYGVR